ncbi:hypothetical protein [Acinetobacter sp. YH12045]|uniref:DUF3885 domain-containing protein n=1 Tax=Acinetobacter sp. YH12045 TaxID=2601051 RepID=UPI0015D3DAC4|nr:hypothetical protein [Acinetobacter sp. YH12045]
MTKTFEQQWNDHFPNKVPIPYVFKFYFSEYWFHIHSLPKSKQYADTTEEVLLLLDHQNQIITDCLGLDTSVYLVTGNYITPHYSQPEPNYFHPEYDRRKIISYNLIESPSINLHQIDPDYFDDGDKNDDCFIPLYTQVIWRPKKHDDLLLKIANEEIEAFLISFDKKIIVAPYDGGIDFIIQDEILKQDLKVKYKDWLSPRDDGL